MPDKEMVYREFQPDLEIRSAAKGGDGRTLVGYAVPFDREQQIDSRLREAFDRSAFNHQLSAIHRVGYYHGHKRDGGLHVGHIVRAEAQPAGLYTESRISRTQAGDELLAMVEDGSVPHQSVGFLVGPGGTEMRNGVAWRVRADLTELAAVPLGAYDDAAAIQGVRAVDMGTTGTCPTCGHVDQRSRLAESRAALASLPVLRV